MRWLLWVFFLFSIDTFSTTQICSASNPPTQNLMENKSNPASSHTENSEQTTDSNQNITTAASHVIKKLSTSNINDQSVQNKNESNEKSFDEGPVSYFTADWWLVYLTAGLITVGIIQAGLFIWQLHLLRRSMDDSRIAAEAARTAANAALASLERPWLIIEGLKLNEVEWLTHKEGMLIATFNIHNYGKAPAIIKALWVTHFRGPDDHNGRPPFDLPKEVLDVPDKDNFGAFVMKHARPPVREVSHTHFDDIHFVVASNSSTDTMCFIGYGPLEPVKTLHPLQCTESYLMGIVFYEIPGQPAEVMSFSYKSNIRGGLSIFRDYAPYNERKKAQPN